MAASGVWITWDKFVQFINSFADKSDKLKDGWQEHVVEGKPFSVFLSKKEVIPADKWTAGLHDSEDDVVPTIQAHHNNDDDDLQVCDPSITPPTSDNEAVTREYHILYSPSYSVPVLMFNCYRQDGSLLPLRDVWRSVPATYQQKLAEEKWSLLSQVEHPLLGQPFYQLHPCNTAHLMAQAPYNEDSNYIVSWLSAVGPVAGLSLSLDYADIKVDSSAPLNMQQQAHDTSATRLDTLMAHTMKLDEEAKHVDATRNPITGPPKKPKAAKSSPNGGQDVVLPGKSNTVDKVGEGGVESRQSTVDDGYKDMSGLNEEDELEGNEFGNSLYLLACDYVELFPDSQPLSLNDDPIFPSYTGPGDKEETDKKATTKEAPPSTPPAKSDREDNKKDGKDKKKEGQDKKKEGEDAKKVSESLPYPIMCVV